MIIYLISLVYLLFVTFLKDPFTYNYSMFSANLFGYFMVITLSIIIGISLYKTSIVLKDKNILCLLAPVVAAVFPYVKDRGDFLSNMHEVMAYVSLGLVLYVSYKNIIRYQSFNIKKAKDYKNILIITLFVDIVYYFDSFKVNSMHEFILLSVIIIIHLLIYLDVKKKVW